jgi:hypothetical protein
VTTKPFPSELTPELREILGLMMWTTGPIAHAFRAAGHEIPRKAEEEQAFVLHWLIGLALEHGSEWRKRGSEIIQEMSQTAKAKATT